MWDNILMWSVLSANWAVACGTSLFLQSTIIIAIGLGVARLARSRGSVAQSFILRAFLAAVFICPAVSLVVESSGVRVLHISIPQASVDSHPANVISLHQSSPVSPSAPLTDDIPLQKNAVSPDIDSLAGEAVGAAISGAGRPATVQFELHSGLPARPMTGGGIRKPEHFPSSGSRPAVFKLGRVLLYLAFTLAWVATTFLLLGRLLLHTLRMLYIRRTAYPAAPRYIETCRAMALELKVRPPDVLQSPLVQCPFLGGLFRPAIFLPLGEYEKEFSSREVLFHELVHLAHHDTLWNLLHRTAVALFPFQPLLWILSKMMEETDDYVCDDFVLSLQGNRRSYVLSLVGAAAALQPVRYENPLGVGFLSFPSALHRRVERILDASRAITLRAGKRLLVLVSSLCLCITFLSGLVGFRISFAQARKFSEAISRGGRVVVFTLLPLVEKQVTTVLKPSGESSRTVGAVSCEEAATAEETLASAVESAGESAAATMSTDISAVHASAPSPLSDGEIAPDHPAALESDTVPSLAAFGSENPPMGKNSGKHTASAASIPFPPPALNETLALSPNTGSIEGDVKTGELNINAKEQETYSGLKSNLDWGKRSPVWSPDGKTIAFTEYTGFGIWTAPAGGGEPRLVYDNRGEWEYEGRKFGGGNMRTLCFTPDGKNITFVNYVFDRTRGSRVDFSGAELIVLGIVPVIETVSIATGGKRIVAMNVVDGCWTPDGKTFVAVTEPEEGKTLGQIVTLDLASEEVCILAEEGASPCITPDGRTVIFTGGLSLYRVPLSGGDPERLPVEGCLWNPRCSPDGVWVMGTGNKDGDTSRTRLLAFNLLTGKTRDIPPSETENVEMGSWSPSGKQFCYTKSAIEGNAESTIWIADFLLESGGSPASVDEHLPAQFKLIGNYPNPFNPSTTIEFSLPSASKASLAVYNMTGQKVRELVTEQLSAGKHAVVWNGRDSSGNPVSSGVYIVRLKMEGKVESHRMTLVK